MPLNQFYDAGFTTLSLCPRGRPEMSKEAPETERFPPGNEESSCESVRVKKSSSDSYGEAPELICEVKENLSARYYQKEQDLRESRAEWNY